MKWRKKLGKPKNAFNILLPGRTLTFQNFAFKARSRRSRHAHEVLTNF